MVTPAALARAIWAAGVAAVSPDRLFDSLSESDLPPDGLVRILVAGKASGGLAAAVHRRLGERIGDALVVLPDGAPPASHPFLTVAAGHPLPTAQSVAAGRAALELAQRCSGDGTPLLVLISGGASALLEVPAGKLSLDDLIRTSSALMRAGCAIGDLNVVRKHLSTIKGGRLAAAAGPAPVWTLALSDVIGNDPSSIGSGPTAPDPSTFADALRVVERSGAEVPGAVLRHLSNGADGGEPETPIELPYSRVQLLGSNADALSAARVEGEHAGLPVTIVTEGLAGEAREVGRKLAAYLADASPGVYLWGGETTVTVRGKGRGGRNQELALSAAIALEDVNRTIALLSAGTDGVDGPTPAAGAVVSTDTASALRRARYDPEAALADNDSFVLFDRASKGGLPSGDGLVQTGPTGTNVMDLVVGIVASAPSARRGG